MDAPLRSVHRIAPAGCNSRRSRHAGPRIGARCASCGRDAPASSGAVASHPVVASHPAGARRAPRAGCAAGERRHPAAIRANLRAVAAALAADPGGSRASRRAEVAVAAAEPAVGRATPRRAVAVVAADPAGDRATLARAAVVAAAEPGGDRATLARAVAPAVVEAAGTPVILANPVPVAEVAVLRGARAAHGRAPPRRRAPETRPAVPAAHARPISNLCIRAWLDVSTDGEDCHAPPRRSELGISVYCGVYARSSQVRICEAASYCAVTVFVCALPVTIVPLHEYVPVSA
jgi:hypothetical protein